MVCFFVFLTLFSYTINSAYPNEPVTRMLLHLSILFLITKLMLNKIKNSEEQKKSDLVVTAGIMTMIPVVFLSFGAQFVEVDFSSTNLIFYIFFFTLILFFTFKIKETKNKIKAWKKQLLSSLRQSSTL